MSWKLMLPPQILAGQVNPVVLSAPTVVCQQLAGRFKAVAPSKPELNRSFAEPCGSVVTDKAADGVVTDNVEDGAETLPAASRAETVKEYGVLAESPLIEADVPPGEATSVPLRYT